MNISLCLDPRRPSAISLEDPIVGDHKKFNLSISVFERAVRPRSTVCMRRSAIILGAILLSVQGASASDTTGALVLIPIVGGVIGLVIGAVICIVVCSRRQGQ